MIKKNHKNSHWIDAQQVASNYHAFYSVLYAHDHLLALNNTRDIIKGVKETKQQWEEYKTITAEIIELMDRLNALYPKLGGKEEPIQCTHHQCNNEAVKNTDACEDHTFCDCPKVSGKYHAHYKPECPKKGGNK